MVFYSRGRVGEPVAWEALQKRVQAGDGHHQQQDSCSSG